MECPHCFNFIADQWGENVVSDENGEWTFSYTSCANCNTLIVDLTDSDGTTIRINPPPKRRISDEVPKSFRNDHAEALAVLPRSEKASAALSRRCLQQLLREHAGVKPGDLAKEIQEVLDTNQLPSYLADDLDAVRNIGNFAAHPMKSKSTGEIVQVETGEAKWLLDVLEGLFDFYFVQTARARERRDALNGKLVDAGKPPIKKVVM
jgi:hypothetical protein